ncbi:hypothetical protein [Niveispirillum sp. KHB5.9]|uniref:hypothetical protein n=1 Tax=Niveispirillum sp. KHB5.9 TaxID=3400269 RepID=UPI003A853DA9
MTTYSHFNVINGTVAAEAINGGAGFDWITGGAGNDVVNGGGGLNAAVFTGNSRDYDIDVDNGIATISGADGTDTLQNVQFAVFADKTVALFEATPLFSGFDEDFYLQSNPDVLAAVQAGVYESGEEHFENYGKFENRVYQATDGFDAAYYAEVYGDVQAAGIAAVTHYETNGQAEGRSTHLYFDANYYLEANPDVALAGVDPWTHYATYGWKEGRNPSPFFDVDAYLTANPDVAAGGIDPLYHYLNWGEEEGRQAHIDTSFYAIA